MKRFSSKDLLSLTQDEYSRVYRHFLANAIYHLPPDQIELDIRDEILIQISESTASWLHTSFDFHLLELGIETGLNTATKTPDPVHHPSICISLLGREGRLRSRIGRGRLLWLLWLRRGR